jgi:flagellar M-ring protein FliF
VTRGITDTEYDYGRRVEQVVAAPGGVTRLSVGVIVPGATDLAMQGRIEDLVRVAAGINDSRGDLVVVQSLDGLGPDTAAMAPPAVAAVEPGTDEVTPPAAVAVIEASWWNRWYVWAGGGLLFAGLLLLALSGRSRPGRLSIDERAQLLADVRASLERGGPRMSAAGGAP